MSPPLNIVCLSSQPWEDEMWTNKQHIMSRVAEQHRVLYVNFGSMSPLKFLARARQREQRPGVLTPRRLLEPVSYRVREGLEVVEIWSPPWFSSLEPSHPLRVELEFDRRVRALGRWLARRGISDAVFWVYHPGYGGSVAKLPHRAVLYDCVDEYTAFPEFARARGWIRRRERALCRVADVVSCTAPALYEAKRSLAPGRTHLVHNVGDAEHFERATLASTEVPRELSELPRPILTFIGAVSDYKLNLDWLYALATQRPEYTLLVIGPVGVADPGTDVAKLSALPNVKLLGHRSYDSLPGYLKGTDVALIPYRINDYTRAVFPIKFFELMATGKPLVISPLPALEAFWDSVLVAHTAEQFIQQCDAALQEHAAEAQEQRVALARRHSWPARVRQLLDLLEAALAARP